jgi:hypothetical protein
MGAELIGKNLGQIREADHSKTLDLVSQAILDGTGTPHLAYRTLSPEEQARFATSGSTEIEALTGGKVWAGEYYLLGDLAFIVHSNEAALGCLSFSLLNNGDALIVQVQGKKGKPFTPDRRRQLIDATVDFATRIGLNRLLLVTGGIVNGVKGVSNPRIERVYQEIATENGFDKHLDGIPYRNLQK